MQMIASATAQFHANGSITLLDSHGPVEIGTRAGCKVEHGPREECDLCRGECLGAGEHPPAARYLPERFTAEDKAPSVNMGPHALSCPARGGTVTDCNCEVRRM